MTSNRAPHDWYPLFPNPVLAEKCRTTRRTVYRDIQVLETSEFLRFWRDKGRIGIVQGSFIPLTLLTVHEALCIFLAVRLMSRYSNRYDAFVASTFQKLNSAVPSPLKEQVSKTLDWMVKLPADRRSSTVLHTVAEAWVKNQRVRIAYRSLADEKPAVRVIEPYCVEPAAAGHANYVVAYCHKARGIRTFKIERIHSAEILQQKYAIPWEFDASKHFSPAWGIVAEGEAKNIRMRLKPGLARIAQEVVWHPSQKLETRKDKSAAMTVTVVDTPEFYNWVLGWGDEIEVLSPADVRQNLIEKARKTVAVYERVRH